MRLHHRKTPERKGRQEGKREGYQSEKREGKRVLFRKLSAKGGFSLAETLFCCLILALSSVTLIQTMRLAGEQFNTRTRESDARILCNTLSQAVQEYLSCATDWTTDADGAVTEFYTGAIPSREEPVLCSFTTTAKGYLALNYGGGSPLLLAPAADYVMHEGRPTLEVESFSVKYEEGLFNVSIRVSPNQMGPMWDAEMQEVQNDFIVIPIPSPSGSSD